MQPENPKDRTYIGLAQLIKGRQQKLLFAQKELMKEPQSLRANVKFIWGLIYNSRMPDALKAYNLLKRKTDSPLIAMDDATEADRQAFHQLGAVLLQNEEQSPADAARWPPIQKQVQSLCKASQLANESDDPEEFKSAMIERIAIGLVKAIASTERPKKRTQLLSELSFLLQSLVFQQGQHQVFIKLTERMLQVAVSLPSQD